MTIRRPMPHPLLHACRMPMRSSLQQQTSGGTTAAQQSPPPLALHHLPSKVAQLSAHHTAHLIWQLGHPCPPPLPCPAQASEQPAGRAPKQRRPLSNTPL